MSYWLTVSCKIGPKIETFIRKNQSRLQIFMSTYRCQRSIVRMLTEGHVFADHSYDHMKHNTISDSPRYLHSFYFFTWSNFNPFLPDCKTSFSRIFYIFQVLPCQRMLISMSKDSLHKFCNELFRNAYAGVDDDIKWFGKRSIEPVTDVLKVYRTSGKWSSLFCLRVNPFFFREEAIDLSVGGEAVQPSEMKI